MSLDHWKGLHLKGPFEVPSFYGFNLCSTFDICNRRMVLGTNSSRMNGSPGFGTATEFRAVSMFAVRVSRWFSCPGHVASGHPVGPPPDEHGTQEHVWSPFGPP